MTINNAPPHYINGDEYFQSSVLMTFIIKDDDYFLVLEQRSTHISQAGEVCFPGGRFDATVDLSTKDTAIRETCEELGVEVSQIKKVRYWGTYIAPMYTLIDVYIGFLDINSMPIDDVHSLPINKKEVEKLIVVPYSYFLEHSPLSYEIDNWSTPYRLSSDEDSKELSIFPTKELGLPSRYHKPWQGKPRQVYLYPTQDVPIWGVTANILKQFVQQHPTTNTLFSEVHYE
ncbi:MAG TPA: CoA pyrophosphatase [Epulopiscium sp.]|nr:CoA pyrophosphatase [Candidatus Epulonipiscium sp.]